jgi:hypothetical protein
MIVVHEHISLSHILQILYLSKKYIANSLKLYVKTVGEEKARG